MADTEMSQSSPATRLPEEMPLLALMPPEVRRLVAASFVPQSFRFGEVIVREGDDADAFYVVVSGRARVVKEAPDGQEVTLAVLGPGDSFGETALLEHGPRTATVRASEDVEALRLDRALFEPLVATNPSVLEYVQLHRRRLALHNFFRLYTAFGELPRDGLETLLGDLEEVTVARGAVVIREGDEPGPAYVVEEGRLLARRGGSDVAYYRRGDVFGERSLFTSTPRAATIEAVSDCRLLRLPASTFRHLLDAYPAFRADIAQRVAQYDYPTVARVPLDFGEELLPADAQPADRAEDVDEAAGRRAATAEAEAAPPAPPVEALARRPGRIRRVPHVYQIDEADCGAACLAMICRHYGRATSLARARRAVGTGIDGSSLGGITHGAEQLGLAGRAVKASKRNLDDLQLPAILHWDANHWVVLYDVTAKRVRIADPALGLRRLSRDELERRWSGYAALVEPTPAVEEAPAGRPSFAWMRSLLLRYRGRLAVAVTLALAVSGLQMSVPVFLQVVVDSVVPAGDLRLLRMLLLAMVGVLVAMLVGSVVHRYLLSWVAVRVDGSAMNVLSERMLALPMPYFYARRTGDIQRRLAGVQQIRSFAVQNGVLALTALAQLVVAAALMVFYSPLLAGVYLAAAPLYALLMRYAAGRLRPIFDNLEESFGRYYSRQVDAVKGIEAVKAMGAEDELRRELVAEFDALSRRLFRADFSAMLYQAGVQLIAFASLAAFVGVGALQVLAGHMSIGALVSFSALVVLANAAVVLLLNLWDQGQVASVLLGRLSDVFEEDREQGEERAHLAPVPTLAGHVRLEAAGFRYTSRSPPVLTGVNLDVPAGTTVAVVGRSGSGKTTLAKCLVGLLEPTEGRVLYDGVDMTTLDYRQLRRRIGFVLQENYLFADSIARNIAFGEAEPDMGRVEWAARVANAHDFIVRLPLGYDTKIGETGLLLSGGQRQRIAIARAVYHQPPVLILDEATSSLDAESERAVQDSMNRLLDNRTSFVIAHRLSTIRGADVIVVLDRGRVVEQGTHDELMAHRGLYFYLCSQQLDL
jgi:HlyB family type I secretion system ABC transporter